MWHFIDILAARNPGRIDGVARPAMDLLRSYPWPGNVRELRNVIEHAFIVGDDTVLDVDDLTPELRGEAPPDDEPLLEPVFQQRERERILGALAKHQGRRAATAAALGMSRTTLWHKLKRYHLA